MREHLSDVKAAVGTRDDIVLDVYVDPEALLAQLDQLVDLLVRVRLKRDHLKAVVEVRCEFDERLACSIDPDKDDLTVRRLLVREELHEVCDLIPKGAWETVEVVDEHCSERLHRHEPV